MSIDKMKAKRVEVLDRASVLRSVPGTGYHDNDLLGPIKHPLPDGRRDAALNEHAIAFKGRFETVFVDDCSQKVVQAIRAFYEANKDLLNQRGLDQSIRDQIELAMEYAEKEPGWDSMFSVRNAQFNDVLAILHFQGIGVTSTAV